MSALTQSFILHFGEMGSKWGFNRTVGQILGLMIITEEMINAEQITKTLSISRGNVSMALKELQSWRLVKAVHIQGDRKEYYTGIGNIWTMAFTVMEERRKREVEPTLSALRDVLLAEAIDDKDKYAQQRVKELHDLLEQASVWSDEFQKMDAKNLQRLVKLGTGVGKVISIKDKIRNK
jgi:DNA-binding transcriptional regulator GbsR (MarR family)